MEVNVLHTPADSPLTHVKPQKALGKVTGCSDITVFKPVIGVEGKGVLNSFQIRVNVAQFRNQPAP